MECEYANDVARCDVDMSGTCQLDAGVLCCSNYGRRGRATVSSRLGMTVRAGRAGRADMAAKAGKAGRAGRKGKQARENIRLIHFGVYFIHFLESDVCVLEPIPEAGEHRKYLF